MQRPKEALLALVLSAFVSGAMSQPTARTSSQPLLKAQPAAPATVESAASSPSSAEVIALREQNKLIREYHGSLLDTVYWALGGVVTLAALLTGFSWWSNFRVYENDKRRLKEEVEARLKEYESQAALREQEARRTSETATDTKLEAFQTRLAIDLSEVRQEANAVRAEIANAVKQASEPAAAALKRLETAETSLAETMAELRHVEEYVWDLRGNVANILITQGQGLTAAVATDNSFYIENVLKRMKSTINEKVLGKNVALNARVLDIVRDRLSTAEKKRPIEVAELRDLIASIKVATPPPEPPTTAGAGAG